MKFHLSVGILDISKCDEIERKLYGWKNYKLKHQMGWLEIDTEVEAHSLEAARCVFTNMLTYYFLIEFDTIINLGDPLSWR